MTDETRRQWIAQAAFGAFSAEDLPYVIVERTHWQRITAVAAAAVRWANPADPDDEAHPECWALSSAVDALQPDDLEQLATR